MNRASLPLVGQALGLATLLSVVLGASVHANAQWLPDRNYNQGPRIRAGELELHPGNAVRGGYDNNIFRADGKTEDGVKRPLTGGAILAVTPHLNLSTETAQRAT